MRNPFYILHVTDFHFADSYFESKLVNGGKKKKIKLKKPEKIKEEEKTLSSIKALIQDYLKQEKIDSIDFMAITGDMVDRNGALGGYDRAVNFVNDLKSSFLASKGSLFVAPGNHDLDTGKLKDFFNKQRLGPYVNNMELPNSELVDKFKDQMKDSFDQYSDFAKDVNAFNCSSPLNGCTSFKMGKSNIFVSWFNTAWFCLGPKWKDVEECKYIKGDSNVLTVGAEINKDIYTEFESFNSDNNEFCFRLSLSHHFPRFLNFYDKHVVVKDYKLNTLREEELEHLSDKFKRDDGYVIPVVDNCYYSHIEKYDLVLNGHTHGELLNDPFVTSVGCFTDYANFGHQGVSIVKVDLARGYSLVNSLVVDRDGTNPKIQVFNRKRLLKKIRSNYTSEDILTDINLNSDLSNGIMSVKDATHPSDYTFDRTSLSQISRKNLEEEIVFPIREIQRNPFIKEEFISEMMLLSKKMSQEH